MQVYLIICHNQSDLISSFIMYVLVAFRAADEIKNK